MEVSLLLRGLWVTIKKSIEYLEKDLKFALQIDDRGGKGGTYGNLGNA